jgi:uncharacterized membrane protein
MTNLTENRINRDGTADLLKGFAVLFMIQVHIMEQFASVDTYKSVIGEISMFLGGPFCAPVFLAVMGYYLAYSKKPLLYFLKRGVLLFAGGILLNASRSANLLIKILQGGIDLDPWFFIMGADILTLAGLSLVLTGLLRVVFRDIYWLYILAAIIVVAISPYLLQPEAKGIAVKYVVGFILGTEEWSYFPLFPWFAYVLTGYSLRLFLKQTPGVRNMDVQNLVPYLIPVILVIILTLPFASGYTYNLSGPGGYYHHGILFYGWMLLFMISYLVLMNLADKFYGDHRIMRIVKWIGQRVTSLYVIQWLIIGNMATWLFKSQDIFQFVAWFVVITLVTLLAGYLFEKSRGVTIPGFNRQK